MNSAGRSKLIRLGLGVAASVGLGIILGTAFPWRSPAAAPPIAPGTLQCGHWCVRRVCELLGAPVGTERIAEMLPPDPRGHSLLQLAGVLERIGFVAEGAKESYDSLQRGAFPCIAHLENPEPHYVVVAGADANRVHVFDGLGRRTAERREVFAKEWTGNVLWVRKPSAERPLPLFSQPAAATAPRAQFDALFVDKGTVFKSGAPISFEFRLRNLGKEDLIIKQIAPDCQCIGITKPESPLPPGKSGVIELTYKPTARPGPFFHEAAVETNDPVLPKVTLKVSGFADATVHAIPPTVALRGLAAGVRSTALCFVECDGDEAGFDVIGARCSFPGASVRHFRVAEEKNGERWLPRGASPIAVRKNLWGIELSFVPSARQLGELSGTLDVQTNQRGFERLSVPVRGRVELPVQVYPAILRFSGPAGGRGVVEAAVRAISGRGVRHELTSVSCPIAGVTHSEQTAGDRSETTIRFRAERGALARLAESSIELRFKCAGIDGPIAMSVPVAAFAGMGKSGDSAPYTPD